MHTGKISKLVPLTSQSEVDRTQLVHGHNEAGYGYIDGEDAHSVYFSHSMIDDCPFNALWVGQEVEYELDPQDNERARYVELVHADAVPGRSGVRMPPGEGYSSTVELPGSSVAMHTNNEIDEAEKDHDSKQLLAAVELLEQQLETPIIPGEMLSWMEALQWPVDEVKRILPAVVQGEHRTALQTISREDPELQRRVEQLKVADKDNLNDYGTFLQLYGRLRPAIEGSEPDENKAEALVEDLIDRGLQCVIAIRKQELALKTWFVEALERDRGSVD